MSIYECRLASRPIVVALTSFVPSTRRRRIRFGTGTRGTGDGESRCESYYVSVVVRGNATIVNHRIVTTSIDGVGGKCHTVVEAQPPSAPAHPQDLRPLLNQPANHANSYPFLESLHSFAIYIHVCRLARKWREVDTEEKQEQATGGVYQREALVRL